MPRLFHTISTQTQGNSATVSLKKAFHGRLRSAELLLQEDGGVRLIRRAETPGDYFATFDFCDIFNNVRN